VSTGHPSGNAPVMTGAVGTVSLLLGLVLGGVVGYYVNTIT
jgi:hypothetical protein